MNKTISITEIDYSDRVQAGDFLFLMDQYANDSMGLEDPLPKQIQKSLCAQLQDFPGAVTFLAHQLERPVGLVTGLLSFSTFDARKVMNVHDLFVIRDDRGKGIGDQLLQAVQKRARQLNCCRLTIEVRDDNHSARKLYERFGFEDGDPPVRFMTKEFY